MNTAPPDVLAKPLTLPCGVVLPNRLAKAAMTEQMAGNDNAPNERIVRLYQRWSDSGAGLLITGNVMVDRRYLEHSRNVVVEDERDMNLLRRWAEAATQSGAHAWVQVSHAGRQCPKKVTRYPIGPSEVRVKGLESIIAKPRAMTGAEIEGTIARYARTAGIVKEAGFTGVQVHGAHGYLISQFLSPIANQRTDQWGGSLENRMRFLLEVIRAVRETVGPGYPIGLKLNSADFQRGGFSEEESMQVVQAAESAGIDLLEISGGNYENPAFVAIAESTRRREAFFLDYAEKVRRLVKLPLMLTGGFRTAAAMSDAIDSGAIDVVGLARPIAVEPDLPRRLLSGEATGAVPITIRLGVKLLDDMMQSFWFNQQMQRMADGLAPDPNRGKLPTFLVGARDNLLWNPFKRDRAAPHA
ncbi:MAG: NADH:flavin oxidoreductase/NADH oxidase family protein [Candidatus Hydrogenedentes bacterium]|nr:NADH:flavin oxidoreductase/NADH oxidase family protein [Candidatus Hydrogenedentota bacterium]